MRRNSWILLGLVAVLLVPVCIFRSTGRSGEVFTTSETLTAMINQRVSSLNVQITPLEVLEDSRCPVDVQCVWAGTVRLRAQFVDATGETEQVCTLDTPIMIEAHEVELVKVWPEPQAGKAIAPSEYRFEFRVTKVLPK